MSQVFGVAPPQTLFHTRHSPSPAGYHTSRAGSRVIRVSERRCPHRLQAFAMSIGRLTRVQRRTIDLALPSPVSSYYQRGGTPSTATWLGDGIPLQFIHTINIPSTLSTTSLTGWKECCTIRPAPVLILMTSVFRMTGRPLAELHEYLNGGEGPTTPFTPSSPQASDRRSSISSKSRAASLPSRPNLTSISGFRILRHHSQARSDGLSDT